MGVLFLDFCSHNIKSTYIVDGRVNLKYCERDRPLVAGLLLAEFGTESDNLLNRRVCSGKE